ncbi:MAG: c-type cytochrome [Bryobacteraceae bacterium]
MKFGKTFRPAVITAAAVLTLCPVALAQKRWDAPRIVTWNCSGCHGIDGNAQLPFFPRLAGLNAVYAEQRMAQFRAATPPPVDELFNRITALAEGKAGASSLQARINMIGSAHALTDEETKTAIAWYAMQRPAPGRSGNPALIQLGKPLFLNGLPAQGLPPCQSCHGAQAEGKGKIPRLAGQNGTYLLGELAKFHAGDRQHAPEMTMVAEHVDTEQFRALAAYLQSR